MRCAYCALRAATTQEGAVPASAETRRRLSSAARMSTAICGVDFDRAYARSGTTIAHVCAHVGYAALPISLLAHRLKSVQYARRDRGKHHGA
jgi:hypothetical protein